VDYTKMTPILLQAIKEQQVQIQEQHVEIQKQTTEIAKIRSEMKELRKQLEKGLPSRSIAKTQAVKK
ncbi:MAG: hypothetical protein HKN76_08405, partial [Saprospiraceae bacterium]|nr:hypothetical protein [Saprospiraceae bacterium]